MPDERPTGNSEQDQRDLHDLGGEIGTADATARRDPDAGPAPEPRVDPSSAMAVDSVPDQVRTGMNDQDETGLVQQGEELRPVEESAGEAADDGR